MCGIAGIVNMNGACARKEVIEAMTASLDHRGPDGFGIEVHSRVALGHRRLAIIDPAGGKQPMSNENGRIWISYNGELYNHQELRRELQSKGHVFRTRSDTEAVIHAYEEWGERCVERFRGMFAFGIVDWHIGRLFLARDHFGIKPLYYLQSPEVFAFASEIQALRRIPGIALTLDLGAVDQFLWLQYIPAPRTAFKEISKLPPAHCLSISLDGATQGAREYWNVAFDPDHGRAEGEWIEGLDAVLRDSVKAHLLSDVPFGAFLSGGVDSSLVVAYMAQALNRPVKTFSIGFREPEFNETEYSAFASRQWGTEHRVEIIKPDALEILPKLVEHYGDLFGDSSALPTYFVSQLARESVPMVLSGDGADEIFAGYWSHGDWMASFTEDSSLLPTLEHWLKFVNYLPTPLRNELWRPEYRHICPTPLTSFEQEFARAASMSLCHKVQYLDLKTYLPYAILTKVDIASMAHGLEVRTPFVDTRVVEFAARIPEHFNIARNASGGFDRKLLLKKVAQKYFPAEFLNRPKMGFAVPLKRWFAPGGDLHEALRSRLTGQGSLLHEYFEPPVIGGMIDNGLNGPLWLLLTLEEWLRQNPVSQRCSQEQPSLREKTLAAAADPAKACPGKGLSVLFFYDEAGWAWWHRARHIKASIDPEIRIDIVRAGEPFNHEAYDFIVLFEHYLFECVREVPRNKIIVGCSCPRTIENCLELLARENCAAGLVNNLSTFRQIAHQNRFFCCQNGVDADLFHPAPKPTLPPAACWVGNANSMGNKGLDLIDKACRLAGVELHALDQSRNLFEGKLLTQEQLRDNLYHKASFYICASEAEGTPNPALEALSCGLPVISTRVGNMPEIIIDGYNGYLVERSVEAIAAAIRSIQAADIQELSRNARLSILNGWTWKQQAVKYEYMFRTVAAGERSDARERRTSDGYSFCIITNGARPEKLQRELASIRALNIPEYEILVAGDLPSEMTAVGFAFFPLPEAARGGRLGEMRNLLCERARYENLVMVDDDMIFHDDFYRGLQRFGSGFDVLATRMLNPDGTRYWDWAAVGGADGRSFHCLLEYEDSHPDVYVTGGLCIIKKRVAQAVRWDGSRGFYQQEDVDFSRRLQAAGYHIRFCPYCTVTHNDPRYSQFDSAVLLKQDLERYRELFLPVSGEQLDDGVTISGFYKAESSGLRWMSACASITIPAASLTYDCLVSFNLVNSSQEHYRAFPFDVAVSYSDKESKVLFNASGQAHHLSFTIPASKQPVVIHLESSSCFSPNKLKISHDVRTLSVMMNGFCIERSIGATLKRTGVDVGDGKELLHRESVPPRSEHGPTQQHLRVLFDISVLGLSLIHEAARTGVFRVVEHLAHELAARPDIKLSFCSIHGTTHDAPDIAQACRRYLADNPALHRIRFFDSQLPLTDVYHSPYHMLSPCVTDRARFLMIHDLIALKFPHFFTKPQVDEARALLKSIRAEDSLFVHSEATKRDICEFAGIAPERIFVTPLAASPELFHPCRDQHRLDAVRQRYGIGAKPYLLSLCTLEPRKNLEHVIRCFARAVHAGAPPDLLLVLVGTKGWGFESILQAAGDDPEIMRRIVFTGYLPDEELAPLYSGALAFVYMSHYEGFGLPPLEAMQCGTPVITSDTSSLPEVVGHAGIMLDPRDESGLARAIVDIAGNRSLRRTLGLTAQKQAAQFSWKTTTDKTVQGYRNSFAYQEARPKRILWVRPDSIGDNVMAASMLPHVKTQYPDAEITVLCQQHVSEIYEASPYVCAVIGFDRLKAYHNEAYRSLILERLRRVKADLALNSLYSREPLYDLLAVGSGARRSVAFQGNLCNIPAEMRQENNRLYTTVIGDDGCHKPEMEHHRDFLGAIGCSPAPLRATFWTKAEDEQMADDFFVKAGLTPELSVALYACGQWGGKIYPHYGRALAGICAERGLSILAVGVARDAEVNRRILDEIGARGLNLAGCTTIRQTAAILKRCRVGIGADTGTAHIACAVGTPNIVILGGGHFGRFFPYSELTSAVSLPLECYQCNWNCRYQQPHCIRDIDPEIVTSAFRQALDEPSQRPRLYLQPKSQWRPSPGEPLWKDCSHYLDCDAIEIREVPGCRE